MIAILGLDERLAELGSGQGVLVALAVALLLGLRHATDPDHLTAVSTLVLSDPRRAARRALELGLAWGMGHALTLVALGLPVVLFRDELPEGVSRAAEMAIGLIIVVLALRLLWRWRRGYLHVHPHEHGGVWHAHPHVHEREHEHSRHEHRHAESLGRTPRAAFGIGLVHGVGGSAGVGILLIGAISNQLEAAAALLVYALATAVSMGVVSAAFGRALASGAAQRRFSTLAPGLATAALAFGAWYLLGAMGTVPYLL